MTDSPNDVSDRRPGATRRTFLVGGSAALGTLAFPPATASATGTFAEEPGPLRLTHGVVTGDVTAGSAEVWARASGPGRAQVVYGTEPAEVRAGSGRHTGAVGLD